MPVRVPLRSTKKSVSMVKKGKTPATDSSKTKHRENKRDKNETLSTTTTRGFLEEKVRHNKLSQANKKISSEKKVERMHTESPAFDFDERALQTVKRKYNREYGKGGKLQGKKEKVDFKNKEFSKRDIHSKKQISKGKVDLKDKISEEEDEDRENQGHASEPKVWRSPSRVLDKSGKKIRVIRKELGSGSVEKGDQVKRKRVIKIDPYDKSNKRLDDTPYLKENVEEKVVEMSKNAQFRAIQPNSSILSFVEENVCDILHTLRGNFRKEWSPVTDICVRCQWFVLFAEASDNKNFRLKE